MTFDQKLTKKKMSGPGSKMAVAVAISDRVVTLKWKQMVFTAQMMVAAAGGALAFVSPNTTLSSYGNDIPPLIQITLKTPLDGSDVTIHFGKVISDGDSWSMKLHEWSESDFEAEAYPDPSSTPTANLVYVITWPGNQTAS